MMSQRFSLFYAGFTANAPALYFNQLLFLDSCVESEDEFVLKTIPKFSKSIREKEDEYHSYIKTAISIANHFEIETLPQPVYSKDYFDWLTHYVDMIERQFPMARIDHYYFLYARKVAEILSNIGLLKTYIDILLDVNQQMDLSKKIEKCLKDTEFILFKLMAAAALLSSEPRQNYFNVFYRLINQEFQPFAKVDVAALQEADLMSLNVKLDDYRIIVNDGFKKCVGMLKELGI
jgi:hypothetical protein